ncbi:MAG: oxidoreductase, partial [Natronospirillum sp.]
MINLHDIRYVRLGTQNLDQAVRYAIDILGLQEIRRRGNAVYFRSDSRDHTLVYFDGAVDDHTTGFELKTYAELVAAKELLSDAGRPVRWGTDAECDDRFVRAFVQFTDTTGNVIDLVWRPMHSGWRYFPSRDAGI